MVKISSNFKSGIKSAVLVENVQFLIHSNQKKIIMHFFKFVAETLAFQCEHFYFELVNENDEIRDMRRVQPYLCPRRRKEKNMMIT